MRTAVSLKYEKQRKLRWLVYWWGPPDPETGKQKRYTKSFRYNREAKAFQSRKQSELGGECQRVRGKDIPLGQLLEEFIEARVAALAYQSRECYANSFTRLRSYFGDGSLVTKIRRQHAETFISKARRRRGPPDPISTWSRRQLVVHCRALFNAGVDWGYLADNPFCAPKGKGRSVLTVKAKSKPWHHLTVQEFNRLMSVVTMPDRRAFYWMTYGCGLRPGEAYNLTSDKLDLVKRVVHIQNRHASDDVPPFNVKADAMSSGTKERTVSVPEAAVADLTEALRLSFKAGRFLCLSPRRFTIVRENWRRCRRGDGWAGHGPRPWQNRDMVNNLLRDTKAYLRKAGVELSAAFTLHTFRKSFGQNHADNATPPRTLAELLGHSDPMVTMEFYNRVTDANQRAAAATMDRLLGSASKLAVGGE